MTCVFVGFPCDWHNEVKAERLSLLRQLEKQFDVLKASWWGGGEPVFSASSAIEFLCVLWWNTSPFWAFVSAPSPHKQVVSTFPHLSFCELKDSYCLTEHWTMQLFSFSPWATMFLYYHQRGEEVLCWIIALRKPAIADQPKSIPVRSLSGCSSVVRCVLIFQCYWVPITWKRLCWVGIEQ